MSYQLLRAKKSASPLTVRLMIIAAVIILSTVAYFVIQHLTAQSRYITQKVAAAEIELTDTIILTKEPTAVFAAGRLPEIQNAIRSNVLLNIPIHLQESPLSCEVAALKMALQYKGINVSEKELMNYVGYDPTPHIGNTWGNPHQAFVGDINGRQPTTGYGVYWEPIARAGANYRPTEYFTSGTVQDLTEEIASGNPVVVWGNAASGRRIDWHTPDGQYIVAISGEHTLTVTGFHGPQNNPTHIIYNDPHSGQVVQPVKQFEQQWSLLGHAGVVVR